MFRNNLFVCWLLVLCMFPFGCSHPGAKKINEDMIGTLIFRDPMVNQSNLSDRGLVFCTLPEMQLYPAGHDGYNAYFMDDEETILLTGAGTVELFDVRSQKSRIVYEIDALQNFEVACVDANHFSIATKGKVVLVDILSGEQRVIVDDVSNNVHSWSDDGTMLYYSNSNYEIVRKNIKNGDTTILCEGIKPVVSNDGTKIIYMPKVNHEYIVIRDLASGYIRSYDIPVKDYCFSPDANYIACVEYWRGNGFYDGYSIKIWDYQNNQTEVVWDKCQNAWSIDWI